MECMYVELGRAASVDEIIDLTRDYLASWTVEELECLPDSCRPKGVNGPRDIELWADRLLGHGKTRMPIEDERKLDRLTSHFLIASVRIRDLAGTRLQAAPAPRHRRGPRPAPGAVAR